MKRKCWHLLLFLLILFTAFESYSATRVRRKFYSFDRGQSGIGLLLGKPVGARYVYWLGWKRAIFTDVVYDFDGIVSAQGSYAFYFYDAKDQFRRKKGFNSFQFYVAPGLHAGVRVKGTDQSSSVVLGARGVGGFEYVLGSGQWALRGELGGTVNMIGRTFATFHGLVGITYYLRDKVVTTRRSVPEGEIDKRIDAPNSDEDEFSEFE